MSALAIVLITCMGVALAEFLVLAVWATYRMLSDRGIDERRFWRELRRKR